LEIINSLRRENRLASAWGCDVLIPFNAQCEAIEQVEE
jgi:hypothetical protein